MAETKTRESNLTTELILSNVRIGDVVSYTPHDASSSVVHRSVWRSGIFILDLPPLPSGREVNHYQITVTNHTTYPMHPWRVDILPTGESIPIEVVRIDLEPTTAPNPTIPPFMSPDDLPGGDRPGEGLEFRDGAFRILGSHTGDENRTAISRGMDCYQLLRKLEEMDITKKNKLNLANLINKKVIIGEKAQEVCLDTTKRRIRLDTNERKTS